MAYEQAVNIVIVLKQCQQWLKIGAKRLSADRVERFAVIAATRCGDAQPHDEGGV